MPAVMTLQLVPFPLPFGKVEPLTAQRAHVDEDFQHRVRERGQLGIATSVGSGEGGVVGNWRPSVIPSGPGAATGAKMELRGCQRNPNRETAS